MSDSYDWEKMDKAMQERIESELAEDIVVYSDQPEPEEPEAWHNIYITTTGPWHANAVEVYEETNDDNDDGYPDGETVSFHLDFPNLEAALKHAGYKSHRGVSGVRVRVFVDGIERQ